MSDLQKYVLRNPLLPFEIPYPEITSPKLGLVSGADGWGPLDINLTMTWVPIHQPFEMISEHHRHDFNQFLLFVGGDIRDMTDLGGEVEFWLSEDGKNPEKFVFTEATFFYIPAGLYHSPLNFKRIDDPSKPILFQNVFFAPRYSKKQ